MGALGSYIVVMVGSGLTAALANSRSNHGLLHAKVPTGDFGFCEGYRCALALLESMCGANVKHSTLWAGIAFDKTAGLRLEAPPEFLY